MTEDEMVGWHHQFIGHELGETSGDGEGQGSLACCSPWGHRIITTWQLNNIHLPKAGTPQIVWVGKNQWPQSSQCHPRRECRHSCLRALKSSWSPGLKAQVSFFFLFSIWDVYLFQKYPSTLMVQNSSSSGKLILHLGHFS